jgi:hypothetical protein
LEGALRELLERAGAQFVDLSEQEREEFVAVSAPAIEMARDRLPEDLLSLALA